MILDPIPEPAWAGEKLEYQTRPRERRSFHTILDAAAVFPSVGHTTVEVHSDEETSTLVSSLEMREGHISERVGHARRAGSHGHTLSLLSLERKIFDKRDKPVRHEIVDFASQTHPLPACTYVDVSAPFLLGGQPFDKKSRSLYAWICDRFVARVYYESRGTSRIDVPAGSFATHEVIMYPDLNDWVSLPSIITKLSKPFVPKYHMWYETTAPHRLIAFEGPLGPPGAPELRLDLQRVTKKPA
ncbi:MAG: hypothetical protein U0271_22300 [Polyangiaceae bacterium]